MNRKIHYISIANDITGYWRGEKPRRNIEVSIQRQRDGEESQCRVYETNPIGRSKPHISKASVKRARRALKAFSQAKT